MPHFLGAPKSERLLLPRRAAAFWEGTVLFGRNWESRSREAAGRRNWPEAVPKKMSGKKADVPGVSESPKRTDLSEHCANVRSAGWNDAAAD